MSGKILIIKIKNMYNKQYGVKPSTAPKLNIDRKEREQSKALMREIFEVQSYSGMEERMYSFITEFVWGLNDDTILLDTDAKGNLYITKGEAVTYPCIVSHMDTVHRIIHDDDYEVIDNDVHFFAIDKANVRMSGVGGDDKCGIFTCLDNLSRYDVIKMVFFVEEEWGCIGSENCDMKFFNDVSFVLQADRTGYTDVVSDIMYTEMFDGEFYKAIYDPMVKFGREISDGGMTDVMQLAHNGLEVAMANFSCGYYNPHSDDEYVVIDELILTSMFFRDIIYACYSDGKVWEMKREDRYDKGYYGGYKYDSYGSCGTPEIDTLPNTYSRAYYDEEECYRCGSHMIYDKEAELWYCNQCLDYDYSKDKVLEPDSKTFNEGNKNDDFPEFNNDEAKDDLPY